MGKYKTNMGWDYSSSVLDGIGHIIDDKGAVVIREIYREDAFKLLALLKTIGK